MTIIIDSFEHRFRRCPFNIQSVERQILRLLDKVRWADSYLSESDIENETRVYCQQVKDTAEKKIEKLKKLLDNKPEK